MQASQPSAASSSELSHAAAATQYARDVVAGKIIACKWVILACKRHLDDLSKSKQSSYLYRFDDLKANHVCRFIEALPHIKGEWAQKRMKIKLEPWQQFILCAIFGWVWKDTGYRRFRTCYIAVPRKNAKSTISAGAGLYLLAADREEGAEVFAGNITEVEAWKIFEPALRMVKRSPELAKLFGIKFGADSIWCEDTGSKFRTLIGHPADGDSPHGVLIDEYHQFKDDHLYDAMRSGMGSRRQPLLLITTTAGVNEAGPCRAMQRDVEQTLEGTIERDSLFGIVYTIDAGDDWTSEIALRKSNPNYGVSVDIRDIQDEQRVAITSARKQNQFKTKRLNVWCSSAISWINMQQWNTLADASLREEEFRGQTCIIGLDLASVSDIAACVKVFRRVIDNKEHFYFFTRFYLPEDVADAAENQHYQEWLKNHHLIGTEGNETDFGVIRADLLKDAADFRVKELAFDRYQAVTVKQDVVRENQSLVTAEVSKVVQHFSEPSKFLARLVEGGRIHHDGNPVMRWMVSNVVVREDENGNILPKKDKSRPDQKIDGVDALIYALSRVHAGVLNQPAPFKPFFL